MALMFFEGRDISDRLPEKSKSIEWAYGDTSDNYASRCAILGVMHTFGGKAQQGASGGGGGRLTGSSTDLAPIIDFFGSRFDQAKISVARTAQEAEDARERMEIRMASFPLKNDLLS